MYLLINHLFFQSNYGHFCFLFFKFCIKERLDLEYDLEKYYERFINEARSRGFVLQYQSIISPYFFSINCQSVCTM